MKIYRIGGSSIDSIEKIKSVANVLRDDAPKVVLLSAPSETVISLQRIAACFFSHEIEKAHEAITRLEFKIFEFLNNLLNTEGIRERALNYILSCLRVIWTFARETLKPIEEKQIVAQGELITSALFSFYLEEQGVKNAFLLSTEFLKKGTDRNLDMNYLKSRLKDILLVHKDTPTLITQGDICVNAYGRIDNLNNKESNYSAFSIGTAIEAEEVKIWKDTDSICSANSAK